MTSFVLSEVSGWLIAVLAVITVSLPYLLRGRRLAPQGWGVGYIQRLIPHYWIGYTIAGLSLLHAGFAMSGPIAPAAGYQLGIWIATGGMLLSFGQVSLGLQLRKLRGEKRLQLRRVHFAVMAGLFAVGALHLALNGALVQGLAQLVRI